MGSGRTRTRIMNGRVLFPETGEVQEVLIEQQERTGARARSKEPFGVMYLNTLDSFKGMGLSGQDFVVMFHLIQHMGYQEPFRLPPITRMAEDIGTSRSIVYRALARLREHGILIDVDEDHVLMNPKMFWRGGEEARRGQIILMDYPVDQDAPVD